jgi:DNA invertase Pin-like site-specific DNA recombinase/peptidoglycan hydrolase-like protein with peptidoglycan-binding domain
MHRRWPLAALGTALSLVAAPAAFGADTNPPASAGWHGREIRDPWPQRVRDAVARFPRGWSAGSVGLGSGYAGGSRRVREVQRRLVARGYRPGPVDGRFGPRTRAALLWFQTKHGLPRTGRVDARGLETLRETVPELPRATDATPTPTATATATPVTPEPADMTWLAALVAAFAVAFAALGRRLRAAVRRRPANLGGRSPLRLVPPPHDPREADSPTRAWGGESPSPSPTGVIGYVALAAEARRSWTLDATTRAIAAWCDGRGWRLTRVVHDVEAAGDRLSDRPGLAYALDEIAAGRVAGLVVARLSDLTRSVTELAQLLQWLNEAEAFVIALDHELDTSTSAGELAAGALIEIGDWQRGLIADRTRRGLDAMRAQATADRRSVRDDPQLSARIRAMRDAGMSLQAISDTLNADGVPTLRGGTRWRPSSVQAATGYKRPQASRALPPVTRAQGRWDHDPT